MAGEQLRSSATEGIPGAVCQTPTSAPASGYGSGLISTPLTTLKMAVVAPIPSASVTSAMAVNAGARPNRRKACWIDLMMTSTTHGLTQLAEIPAGKNHAPMPGRARYSQIDGHSDRRHPWRLPGHRHLRPRRYGQGLSCAQPSHGARGGHEDRT